MHRIVRLSGLTPHRALEVGGYVGDSSLLRSRLISRAERWCLNLVEQPEGTGIQHVVGNSNDMRMFNDNSFDLVMSCAVLEHDKRFWRSIAEMKRVLAPGGVMVIAVPGFVRQDSDKNATTATYQVHYRFDYYRFSRRAVKEVFFEGMEDVHVSACLDPPRLVGWGRQPTTSRTGVERRLRSVTGRLPGVSPAPALRPALRRSVLDRVPRRRPRLTST